MIAAPVFQDLIPRVIPLSDIYLDPNNPRFVSSEWQAVPEAEISLAYLIHEG